MHFYAQDSLRLDRFTINVGVRYGSYDGGWQERPRRLQRLRRRASSTRASASCGTSSATAARPSRRTGAATTRRCITYLYDREASGQGVIPDQDCYWDYDDRGLHRLRRPIVDDRGHAWARPTTRTSTRRSSPSSSSSARTCDRRRPHRPPLPRHHGDGQRQRRLRAVHRHRQPAHAAATSRSTTCSRPQDFVLTTDNGAYRDYQSAILRFDKRYSDGWQLRSSLVWTDLKGNSHEQQRLRRRVRGQQRAHQRRRQHGPLATASGSSSSPAPSTSRSTSSSAASTPTSPGWYWTPYVRVRGLDYNAYTGRDINLLPRGSDQFADRNLIDLRLAWSREASARPCA